MLYYKFNHKIVRNTVSIDSSNFTSNKASLWGGAVSLYITRQTDSTNQLTLTECTFDSNTGALGQQHHSLFGILFRKDKAV